MIRMKSLLAATLLFCLTGAAHAVIIDFKSLADGSLGESAWTTLMFRADGSHASSASEAFLAITGRNGNASYAYLDSGHSGLGVCGALLNPSSADAANPGSGTQLCNPDGDGSVGHHGGTPESLHFVFDSTVTIEKIWLKNNHDGDRSLFKDWVNIGGDLSRIMSSPNAASGDHEVLMDLLLGAGRSFDIGFFAPETGQCWDDNGGADGNGGYGAVGNLGLCEFYVSKIEFSVLPAPSPAPLALLGLGLLGMGVVRRWVAPQRLHGSEK